MKKILPLIMLCIILTSCVTEKSAAPGYLEGHVNIGPICPVERPGVPCPVPPEAYAARKIVILENGKAVQKIDIDEKGNYKTPLKPGTYTVDINRAGIDHSAETPAQITVKEAETVTLDISIDTGIR
jgi:hypothetical protein